LIALSFSPELHDPWAAEAFLIARQALNGYNYSTTREELRMTQGAIRRYWPQYKWSNVFAMMKNMKIELKRCAEPFRDRLVVITGASSGVGYHTARKYASMGARILMINRNEEKSERVRREIAGEFGVPVEYLIADLSVLADMQRAGSYLAGLGQPIDVLIHNAGLHLDNRTVTPDGLEVNFALHYLAPLVITNMLVPKLCHDRTGRIIFVGSEGYRFAVWGLDLDDLQWERRQYSGLKGYGAGKLAQLLSMHRLAQELKPCSVTVNAMHPGMVRTETGKDNGRFYQWYKKNIIDKLSDSPETSAEALYYLGASDEVAGVSDVFFHLTTEEELTPPARDLEAAESLWARTLELLRGKGIAL
jgi:NAD(P)-dependent dehydrogenase (short-subunit alcohol dehydrogenase family)